MEIRRKVPDALFLGPYLFTLLKLPTLIEYSRTLPDLTSLINRNYKGRLKNSLALDVEMTAHLNRKIEFLNH